MAVPSAKLGAVSLDNVARFSETAGPSQIDRFGRRRQVMVTANMLTGHSQDAALETIAGPGAWQAVPVHPDFPVWTDDYGSILPLLIRLQ